MFSPQQAISQETMKSSINPSLSGQQGEGAHLPFCISVSLLLWWRRGGAVGHSSLLIPS